MPCGAKCRPAAQAHAARARAHAPAAPPRRAAHGAQVCDGDRGQLFAVLRHLHGAAAGRLWTRLYDGVEFEHVEKLQRDRRRRRDHLRALPSQPHGLSAALVRDLPQGIRGSARRRRRESQHAGDRALPAQGRRVLPAPQLQGRCAVRGGVQPISGLHDGTRPSARILHRGRPQPHRPPAAAAHRHAVDDRAQLTCAIRSGRWCSCRCISATSASSRAEPTSASYRARPKEKESVRRPDQIVVRAAQQVRQGARQPGRAHRAR